MLNKIILQLKNKSYMLDKVNKIVDWISIKKLVIINLKKLPNATGEVGYCPFKMLKVMFVQVLYNLSDREMANSLYYRVSFLKFTGFIYENRTPSHSTIARYIVKLIKLGLFAKLFKLINQDL